MKRSTGYVVFYNTKDQYDLGTPDAVIAHWFGNAIAVLREHGVAADLTENGDEFLGLISKHYHSHPVVLAVSYGVPFEFVGTLPDNVHEYGPRPVDKSLQYDRLRSCGIPVADWVVGARDWEEVFGKLGPRVVVKPNHGVGLGRQVHWVSRENVAQSALSADRVYCKYVGAEVPPYWVARVNCLFGQPVAAYIKRHEADRIMHVLPSMGATIDHRIEPALVQLGARASKVMFDAFGCSLAGVDITGDATGAYVLEVNMHCVGLGSTEFADVGPVYERVAGACMSQLRALGAYPPASESGERPSRE